MTGGSLCLRAGNYGSLQQFNDNSVCGKSKIIARKHSSKTLLAGSREREKQFFPFVFCKFIGRQRVAMLLLLALALVVFALGSFVTNKENTSPTVSQHIGSLVPYGNQLVDDPAALIISGAESTQKDRDSFAKNNLTGSDGNGNQYPPSPALINKVVPPPHHPCENFAFPPPPPLGLRRPGPRSCPVCYLPVEQAIASMPSSPKIPRASEFDICSG